MYTCIFVTIIMYYQQLSILWTRIKELYLEVIKNRNSSDPQSPPNIVSSCQCGASPDPSLAFQKTTTHHSSSSRAWAASWRLHSGAALSLLRWQPPCVSMHFYQSDVCIQPCVSWRVLGGWQSPLWITVDDNTRQISNSLGKDRKIRESLSDQ